jgi:glycosyltransferase involved in cell wall biosynthesis
VNTIDPALIEQFRGRKFLFVLGHYRGMGGSERQALILAEELKQKVGCKIAFLAWAPGPRIEGELKALDIPAYTFPLNWERTRKLGHFFTLRRLAKFIREEIQPDYLLPYIGFNCKIMGLIWQQTGAKYTWWNQRDEGRDIYGSRTERKVLNSVPDVVSNSFEGRDFLINKFDLPQDRVTIINNGIRIPDNVDGKGWRTEQGITDEELLISMVANLTQFKDHITLLKAFAEVLQTHSQLKLRMVLAGRPASTQSVLKELAFDLGLCGHLRFLGEVDNPAVVLAASDLVVHSSIKEGCPNAVLEAMALGRCVCGTDISGIRQAIGDTEALHVLAMPQNVDALANIMSRLLVDDHERQQRGCLNRTRIEQHFSPAGLTQTVLSKIHSHTNF